MLFLQITYNFYCSLYKIGYIPKINIGNSMVCVWFFSHSYFFLIPQHF